jgi:hypothetical protein
MVTGVCHLKKVAHRTWAAFQTRLAFTLATFNLLVQWHGLKPDAHGFVPLSLAEFSLSPTSTNSYYIQRKRWLGEDTNFLQSFWESYKNASQEKDFFFDRWLNVLFFVTFNNKFHGRHRHFPDHIKQALTMAPYLNGGLFSENALD